MSAPLSIEQKSRKAVRSSFSKTCRKIDELLQSDSDSRDVDEVNALFELLEVRYEELIAKDAIISKLMVESEEITEKGIEEEQEHVDEYAFKYFKVKREVTNLNTQTVTNDNYGDGSIDSSGLKSSNYSRKYKLPQLKLKEFDGELGNWLSFWSQFEKIDGDPNLDPSDKYQYLFMATKPGSIAREVVESYPGTNDMYAEAIKALKARFGRSDLLTEFYIRELLSMIIHNAMSNVKMPISKLYDKLQCHLRNLNTLGVTYDNCAPILLPLVVSCLPQDLLKIWERINVPALKQSTPDAGSKEFLPNLIEFLRVEVESGQKVTLASSNFGMGSNNQPYTKTYVHKRDSKPSACPSESIPTAAGLLTTAKSEKGGCVFCSNSHRSQDCKKALSLTLEDRRQVVNNKKACFCCLRFNHTAKHCKDRPRCVVCGKSHFPLLCNDLEKPSDRGADNPTTSSLYNDVEVDKVMSSIVNCNVLLQTLVVLVKGNGHSYKARALIDSASQRSYITSQLARKIGYVPQREELVQHSLFGGATTGVVKHSIVKVFLSSIDGKYHCNFDALDQEKICNNIPPIAQGSWMQELLVKDILLTDINSSGPIEILIGADIAGKLLTGNLIQLHDGPVAIETRLGWTLMGKIPTSTPNEENMGMLVTSMLTKDASIPDLWSLDVLGITDPTEKLTKTEMDLATQKHFEETISVNKEGRFIVHLPWNSDHPALPSNYTLALKRLQCTVRKLKNEGFYEAYQQIFEEWLNEGIIEEVPPNEADSPGHYLPHRHIVKLNSTTTPVRPVFDGSAHEIGAPSLNQCLQKGPNLIEKIPAILAQFRKKKIGVVGDIKRAFLQIVLCKSDRNSLRFLWLDKAGELKIYRHCRVVFGISPSPFLLEASIKLHLDNTLASCTKGESEWPIEIVTQLSRSFYVDNCMTSCEDETTAQSFINAATEILMERQFELRGWELTNTGFDNSSTNVLGLIWNQSEDTLSVNIESLSSMVIEKVTKKVMLSAAHRLFDPIGVTSPVALVPKILIQKTWALGLTWEEEVPRDIEQQFRAWITDINHLSDLKIPRWFSSANSINENWSLHVFSDACQTSYAAVVFLRVELEAHVNVQLIAAKTRVAPIGGPSKNMTIPRLELLGASIAARLCHSVTQEFGFGSIKTTFYTDASTVLAWIIRHETWGTFVGNRIREIRDLTAGCEWQHIPGPENPADMPSRGTSAKKLTESRWWEGPSWLRLPSEHWPKSDVEFNEKEIQSEKKQSVVSSMLCTTTDHGWYYRYFSQYTKIIRMLGWISRFKNNTLLRKSDRIYKDLTKEEFVAAENKAICLVQQETFEDISDPKLTSLLPFKDEEGIIRLRTKVSNREDIHDFCYPAVLPSTDHPFVDRLVMHIHLDCCHAGTQLVLSTLRQRFWILGGRRSVRKVINNCKRCKRHSVKRIETEPSPLPESRVRSAKIFEITGVDLAGPLYLNIDHGSLKKHWICLFTCGVYRAVHLELVSSQSTNSFLLALRRFVNRRGRPQIIYSDQGTNFIGADNAFKDLDWSAICQYSSIHRIEWRFNPPSAPWWGGFWERLIGVLKNLLKRILGRSSVNYEEMLTILCDCESIVNARPLTYLSQDPKDLTPLTPSMFLNDINEVGTADLDMIEATNLHKRYQYRQKLKQTLCRRFRDEYLGQLKLIANHSKKQDLSVGDIVLVGSDNSKRIDWPLARVIDLIKGKDGYVRVARVRTANGELVRPLQRLYPLELDVKTNDETNDNIGDRLRHSIQQPLPDAKPANQDVETGLDDATGDMCASGPLLPAMSRRGRLIKRPEKLNI